MSTEPPKTFAEAASKPTPISKIDIRGATTREQARRIAAEQDAIEDSDKQGHDARMREKEKDFFKGKIDKMDGHVFQLAEESRKGNQFSQTLEALQNYTTIEFEHAKDLAPLFKTPAQDIFLPEPDDFPPMSSDGVTRVNWDNQKYITWKHDCERYDARKDRLHTNLNKLFTVILLQCSHSVKSKVEVVLNHTTQHLSQI